jgi:hypothetical protein
VACNRLEIDLQSTCIFEKCTPSSTWIGAVHPASSLTLQSLCCTNTYLRFIIMQDDHWHATAGRAWNLGRCVLWSCHEYMQTHVRPVPADELRTSQTDYYKRNALGEILSWSANSICIPLLKSINSAVALPATPPETGRCGVRRWWDGLLRQRLYKTTRFSDSHAVRRRLQSLCVARAAAAVEHVQCDPWHLKHRCASMMVHTLIIRTQCAALRRN